MRFLWPELLWLLLFIPALIAAYIYALRRRKKFALRYASLLLVRDAMGPGQRFRRHIPPALFLLAMTAAIFAIARPSAVVVLPADYLTLVMSMDVSRSMRANDVKPTRIDAAQVAAKAFIEELPANVRLGITTFAASASVVQTPTDKRDELRAAVDRFQLQRGTATDSGLIVSLAMLFPNEGIDLESALYGNNFSRRLGGRDRTPRAEVPIDQARKDAVKAGTQRLKPVPVGSYASGAIILLSDGRRTMGPDPLEAAKMAAERGVRVYTVGFGVRDGQGQGDSEGMGYVMQLDEETLKAVAEKTGAEYFYAGTASDLTKVYKTLSSKIGMERRETEVSALFSAGAAVLMLFAGLLSVLWFHRRV